MSAKSGLWNRFQSDKGGNVAMIFGLSALFLVAVTGGAIDFSRINDARNRMQDAADIAVLRGALTASQGDTASSKAAQQAFDDNFDDTNITLGTHALKKTVVSNVSKLNYTATATIKPLFLGLVGMGTQTLSVSSTAQSEVNPFELALVLDITGSMNSSSKLTNLKSSVTSVLNSLLDANGKNSSDVKVGVVPFTTQVRLPTSTSYAYVDYTRCAENSDDGYVNYYLCRSVWKIQDAICASATDKANCLTRAKSKIYYKTSTSGSTTTYTISAMSYEKIGSKYTLYTASLTSIYNSSTFIMTGTPTVTTSANNSNYNTYTNYAPSTYTAFKYLITTVSPNVDLLADAKTSWAGCLVDRNKSYDVSATAFDATIPDSSYVADTCAASTHKAIQDMTTNIADTKTYVNGLVANGNTNITIGVQMGMELLSPEAPYTQGVAWGDPDMDKYMIVVTDGDNTANRWSSTTSTIDARTALACQAAKDKGITVFVVRVMEGNSSMLQKCASKTIYYYDLKTASQLSTAMADIFMRIGKLRITQ
jgi:Flp pilus assembly protein TadG